VLCSSTVHPSLSTTWVCARAVPWPGIRRVLVPARNMRDVRADVPASVKAALEVVPVERLEDVLREAFDPPLLLSPKARL
jgi:ATP-dependent Lon protease